jgi:hypothetical protein
MTMTLADLAEAARAHRDRCAARYGEDSVQVRYAERAVAQLEEALK